MAVAGIESKGFFGHPRGLSTLFFTEFWERFSFYGMRALLIVYMVTSPEAGGLGFDNGNAAMVTNVGTLIEPIANRTEYFSGLKNIPLGIYSHSDQMQQWQTAAPHKISLLN